MAAGACPLCRSARHATLLDRPAVPVLVNRLYASRAAARAAPVGRLDLVACRDCGFVFNRGFDPALITYEQGYENDQTKSPRFTQHLGYMAARLAGLLGHGPARVLEIGCGQGDLLETLWAQGAGRIEAVGYDPAWRPHALPAGLRIEPRPFQAGSEAGRFDVVYARHALEHVADPVALLAAMAASLTPGGRLCLEVPDLAWSLAQRQRQDFFYEHCNYFTASSLAAACRRSGLALVRIEAVFGGQYLWAEIGENGDAPASEPTAPPEFDAACFPLWRPDMARLPDHGVVALWGAGAKGVTFATETDPDATRIACLIDLNPNKQRHFTPRSAHPVVAPAVARDLDIATIVVMNPNYRDEISRAAASAGLRARLLSC
jgi:SAM-dependent methyltransferase